MVQREGNNQGIKPEQFMRIEVIAKVFKNGIAALRSQ
jgi:hypothetical protein